MNAQDEQDLRELQAELVTASASPWEPRCVARAFRRSEQPFVFTMQTWIDLDAARSPFLLLQLPEAETAVEEFEVAFRAFGHFPTRPDRCEPEELILLGEKLIGVIREGFSMRVKLTPPEGQKSDAGIENGLGVWLPILGCLVSQVGIAPDAAMRLPVAQAFALTAAHRCNQGWNVGGETYEHRDVAEDALVTDEPEDGTDG